MCENLVNNEICMPQDTKHERNVHPPSTRYHAPWPIDEPDRLLGMLNKAQSTCHFTTSLVVSSDQAPVPT